MCDGIEYKFSIIEEGIHEVVFTHGSDNTRKKYVYKQSGTIKKTKIYAGGGYEKVMENGNTKEWYFIPGPDGVAAIYERINGGTGSMYYIHKDHLGSYMTITNSAGSYVISGHCKCVLVWARDSSTKKIVGKFGERG
jgi:hypothetical protein